MDYARLHELSAALHVLREQDLLSMQREKELLEGIIQELQLKREEILNVICPVCKNSRYRGARKSPFEVAQGQLSSRAEILFQILRENCGRGMTSQELMEALIRSGVKTTNMHALRAAIGSLATEIEREMGPFGSVIRRFREGGSKEKEYSWESREMLQPENTNS
jgi:hypothetical protein